jgi:hypothetical protein
LKIDCVLTAGGFGPLTQVISCSMYGFTGMVVSLTSVGR